MSIEVKIPAAGESINSASIGAWHKQDGESVAKGDVLATIETDKVSNELEAEEAGVLKILVEEGEEVEIGAVIAHIEEGEGSPAAGSAPAAVAESSPSSGEDSEGTGEVVDITVPAAGESINSASIGAWNRADGDIVAVGEVLVSLETDKVTNEVESEAEGRLEILVSEGEEVDIGALIGRIHVGAKGSSDSTPAPKTDSSLEVKESHEKPAASAAPPKDTPVPKKAVTPNLAASGSAKAEGAGAPRSEGRTTRRKMSMLRRKIAQHLVNAQKTAAILTTFNEVDMTEVMALRKGVQEDFIKKHGCKLGFMSFFVKAVAQALKDVPQINGMIDGNEVVENHFYDIGVAVGTEKGLVVPVLRDCDEKGFAEIEQDILGYAEKARNGQIQIEDLQGGVFTISNGGVYGSLLSTPILNPPQSGILGMHTIQQRPVAVNGKVEIRPMMYLALSYDHRLVDGKEAVTFLIRIKDLLENPARLMLEM